MGGKKKTTNKKPITKHQERKHLTFFFPKEKYFEKVKCLQNNLFLNLLLLQANVFSAGVDT